MFNYILRRLISMIPILIGVNLLTFALFFMVNTPNDMARIQLGQKHVTPEAIEIWKEAHGYHYPLIINTQESGIKTVTQTIFFQKSVKLFMFDFGTSDAGRNINNDITTRMWPSLWIAIPSLLVGLFVNIIVAFIMVFFRRSYLETLGMVVCVMLMSISGLFYIIMGQYVIAKTLNLLPISGYAYSFAGLKFLLLPIIVGVVSGIGMGARWYHTLFAEEIHKDYVRTARAKGLSETVVLFKHVLSNAMIPILTGVVALLPLLFLGSLLTESFFAIPGLGSYTIDAIQQQDFAIVRSMVFLGAVLYILGLILTDIAYTWVDPRVRFQ